MKKIITGVKPTGSSMHLGNLLGAVLPFQKLAKGNDAAIFIADLHALTSVKDGAKMRDQSYELAVEYLSIFGLDTELTIFRQSDIHDITKLMWVMSNVTPYSLMERAHSHKDYLNKLHFYEDTIMPFLFEGLKREVNGISDIDTMHAIMRYFRTQSLDEAFKNFNINTEKLEEIIAMKLPQTPNMGVFNYPILMAADIIGYDIDAVPVGKDQIQHLEMTRDIARAFNKTYGQEVFREPEAIVTEGLATLPGTDGRKMSKSYDNFIGVFDDDKTLKKRVMSIVTGSEGVDEKKKNPDECNVFNLYKVFASAEQTAALRVKYESENIGFGYGHAKTELLNVLTEYLRPYREAREKLLANPDIVEAKLAEGARIMNERLRSKMKVVKEVTGVN
ncbi:MAG: tryptophan--tRNA ligase [Candidatus Gracilibacteria bacterium]|nr:tryptophan--tRNA ligase [Candidatus Gracilibacteria bacterium]